MVTKIFQVKRLLILSITVIENRSGEEAIQGFESWRISGIASSRTSRNDDMLALSLGEFPGLLRRGLLAMTTRWL
jgi:hypothetical protein